MEIGGVHGEPLHSCRPSVLKVEGEPREARKQQEHRRVARSAQPQQRDSEADQRPACEQVGQPDAQIPPGVCLLLRDHAECDPGAGECDECRPAH